MTYLGLVRQDNTITHRPSEKENGAIRASAQRQLLLHSKPCEIDRMLPSAILDRIDVRSTRVGRMTGVGTCDNWPGCECPRIARGERARSWSAGHYDVSASANLLRP